jgi:hypothetical protein
MNIDNQHLDEGLRETFLEKLEAAGTVDALRGLLDEIKANRDAIGVKSAAELARMALSAIATLSTETPEVAAEVISKHLLPACLSVEDQGDISSDLAHERHRLRELLKKWIYQYPQPQMLEVRSRILDHVRKQLEIHPTRELLWVVSSIGFRTPESPSCFGRCWNGKRKSRMLLLG